MADRFEVRRRIGVGEAGTVYVAFDRKRGREIAVRVLLPHLVADEPARQLLFSETRLASTLDHPGIAGVFEVEKDGQLHFVTMELLEGTTLRQRMDALSVAVQSLSVEQVLQLGVALCDALACAHEQTTHGRVRPENVFLCDGGAVKLMDFGVDGLLHAGQSTMMGVSPDRIPYMAPEQLRAAEDADHRADQYATAAVLYEALTGDAPVGRVKPAMEKRPETPESLSRALDRALEPDPADRFADMKAFVDAMTGRSSSGRGRMRYWVLAALIVLVVAVGVTHPRWRGPVGSMIGEVLRDPEARAAAETARTQALAAASNWREVAKLLPDDQVPKAIAQADEAFSAGRKHLADKAHPEAEEAFRLAGELYESHTTATAQALQDAPSTAGVNARDLLEKLDALEQELYARVAESAKLLDGCERSLRSARTDDERAAIEARRDSAEAELSLMNRLKSSVQGNVFSSSLRTEITGSLDRADRHLEAGRRGEALSLYAQTKTRLEDLLAWPDRAESALREHAALSREIDQVRSVLGSMALGLVGVKSALEGAAQETARGNDTLAEGRLAESTALFESAHEYLSQVRAQAVTGLLSLARARHGERKGTPAVLALDELLALDPQHAAAQQLRREILSYRMTNSIGMELVFIPPGEFLMGSPSNEHGRDEDERQRRVKLGKGFYMGATEVTQAQWRAVMGDDPSKWKGDDLPVEQVSWEDVQEFCRRLSTKEGREYRLPTEAEWEYACRAGTTTPFSFGETISTDQANYDGEFTYGSGNKGVFRNETLPVGSFPPNAWGLHDMHGNVWEWCPDGYEDYPPSPVRRTAEEAPIEGRVLRGGSWRSRPKYCRCANRVRDLEGSRLNNIGFRVVVESD
ncbi:MAG: bifunctional serine/threonine-protein kinase/formylglycine-generating enzyme family protein [Planctomycetota bacterium]